MWGVRLRQKERTVVKEVEEQEEVRMLDTPASSSFQEPDGGGGGGDGEPGHPPTHPPTHRAPRCLSLHLISSGSGSYLGGAKTRCSQLNEHGPT